MARRDRRKSLKMKRRHAQVAKKARDHRKREAAKQGLPRTPRAVSKKPAAEAAAPQTPPPAENA